MRGRTDYGPVWNLQGDRRIISSFMLVWQFGLNNITHIMYNLESAVNKFYENSARHGIL